MGRRAARESVRFGQRYSISIERGAGARLDAFCDRTGVSASSLVEALVHRYLDQVGAPMPTREDA